MLAEETGGIAVVNQNDFNKALKKIDNETSDYYVVGYYSSNPDPLRRNRKLEVKVTRWTSPSTAHVTRCGRCRRPRRSGGSAQRPASAAPPLPAAACTASTTRITSATIRGRRLIFG